MPASLSRKNILPLEEGQPKTTIRLNKFIADSGVCSRRSAEILISEGRITVNGKVEENLSTQIDPKKDWVKLDGKRLQPKNIEQELVYAVYKPKGCVSTLFDPEGRETIKKFIPKNAPRLFPVGRLDYDTEGLILLTNDGYLANAIAHPSGEVWKTYLVKIKGILNPADMKAIREGVIWMGKKTLPTQCKIVSEEGDKTWLQLKLREGKNHQIKNIFFKLDYSVLKIKRIQVGTVSLGDLPVGGARKLNLEEVQTLKKSLLKS